MLDVTGMPSWGGWDWSEKYLPADIHSNKGLTKALKHITKSAKGCTDLHGGFALRFGLLLRDIDYCHCLEPDAPPPAGTPLWVTVSPFDLSTKKEVFTCMDAVM